MTHATDDAFAFARSHPLITTIAEQLTLSAALGHVNKHHGKFTLLDHWQQGEFHHDTLLYIESAGPLQGRVVVIATNCNGGVKEVLCFERRPERSALWRARCPSSVEFSGELPPLFAYARTMHWFDPCDLLRPDARSELKEEFRERMPGGGWQASAACGLPKKP